MRAYDDREKNLSVCGYLAHAVPMCAGLDQPHRCAHNLNVLDEPTAAIDPIEETRIYRKFAEIAKGQTSIIVTHRMGSAKIADRIIVMDKGRISEIGTHAELLQAGGKYKYMFQAQAQWYSG